jgi:hypothetical protein
MAREMVLYVAKFWTMKSLARVTGYPTVLQRNIEVSAWCWCGLKQVSMYDTENCRNSLPFKQASIRGFCGVTWNINMDTEWIIPNFLGAIYQGIVMRENKISVAEKIPRRSRKDLKLYLRACPGSKTGQYIVKSRQCPHNSCVCQMINLRLTSFACS